MRTFLILLGRTSLLTLALFQTGCLLVPEDKTYQALTARTESQEQVYKLYPGSVRSTGELAVLQMGDVPSARIDGLDVRKTDYQVVHLLPGEHAVSWRKTFGFSMMVEPAMVKTAERSVTVNLQAGRTYKLFADRTTGAQYQFYFWIQDMASGAIVEGRKKP